MFYQRSHPLNLAIRFALELAILISLGMWGYREAGNGGHILWAILLPVLAMTLWAVFATRNDPSRSGKTVVQTSGPIRLALEWTLFSCAFWALFQMGMPTLARIFILITAVHYLFSIDRLRWLLRQR